MAYFRHVKNQSNYNSNKGVYKIASATAIEKGEMVKLSNRLVVAIGDSDKDDPYLGVAAEKHDGSTADGRQTGTEIMIYDDPNDVFALVSSEAVTLTGGSTSTAVCSSLVATDDLFNGGYIKILTCAADSGLVGKKVKISDYTGSTGTITLAETLGSTLASGDTIAICPGKQFKGQYFFDLNSDGTDINWASSGGESLYFEDSDPETFQVFLRFRLHQRGNYPAAL